MVFGFTSAPKETCQPLLRSIAAGNADATRTGGRDKARLENTITREPYGGRSRGMIVPLGKTVPFFAFPCVGCAFTTRPDMGSHDSAFQLPFSTRNVAFAFNGRLPVFATK